MAKALEWLQENWADETNVGKAKIAAVIALLFLLVTSFLPDAPQQPVEQDERPQAVAEQPAVVDTDDTAVPMAEAEKEAAETYAQYEARVSELTHDQQAAEKEAAATYAQYEARVAELEQELAKAESQARETYQDYEARIADLASLEAGADNSDLRAAAEQAKQTYQNYEARVRELEQEHAEAQRQARETYAQYEQRVAELEQAQGEASQQAAETYAQYEARVAELERENTALREQLAELQSGGQKADASAEMKKQLQMIKVMIDQMLQDQTGE